MAFDPSSKIQDLRILGEFDGVNPSITDSSTYTFGSPDKMKEVFESEIEGCFLYSRHWNPINKYLSSALAELECSESALVTASGMAAISTAILQICSAGDEIISERTIYGGTYALFKNFLPRFGIKAHFVDVLDMNAVESAISDRTKLIYCESISNPLMEVAEIPELSRIAHQHGIRLVVDNTFTPMIISPLTLGADVVVHSLTKFINGTSDCVAGCVCSDKGFIRQMTDINGGASMLLGPVLDSYRTASILKNIHSLHIRLQKHSANALYVAEHFEELGFKVFYPGLPSHGQHELMKQIMNPGFGFGGMVAVDLETRERANELMARMQAYNVGYLAVSLGYFKTLFTSPSSSTASEIPPEEQAILGLSDGLVRMSVGIDNDIERSFGRISRCLEELGFTPMSHEQQS